METDTYWVCWPGEEWKQVTKAEYVQTERDCGFYNSLGESDEPATSWFCGAQGIRGHIGFFHVQAQVFHVETRKV